MKVGINGFYETVTRQLKLFLKIGTLNNIDFQVIF